jgi:hypothetical protein
MDVKLDANNNRAASDDDIPYLLVIDFANNLN